MSSNKKKKKNNVKENESKEIDPCSNPVLLFSSYAQFSKSIGFEPHSDVKKSLTDAENPNCGKQIIIDGSINSFGPGGCRALATTVLGRDKKKLQSEENEIIIYNALQEIRIWKDNIGDYGTMALAELLRLGGSEVKITYLELINTGISIGGALALGRSLSCGMNKSLLSLVLDFNGNLGVDGIGALCKGLRTNSSLLKLSLRYCSIDGEDGGLILGEMLSFPKLSLTNLDLTGNRLGGKGLAAMYTAGLDRNQSLKSINLSDISISPLDHDMRGINTLARLIELHSCIIEIILLNNIFNSEGASILVKALNRNKNITSFKVDTSLSQKYYSALFRNGSKSTKKRKKSTKKKKKKK